MVKTVEEIYVFIAIDNDNGTEGLMSFVDPVKKQWVPLIAADEARLETLKPIAKALSNKAKKPCKLVRFFDKEILEEYEPT